MASLWIRFPVWRELKLTFGLPTGCFAAVVFGYAFPFEGNWNPTIASRNPFAFKLWIRFPVWRELKLNASKCSLLTTKTSPLDTLSRLKGIETVRTRELAGVHWSTLDTLSRLKGIETFTLWLTRHQLDWLWIRFPVWRELKLVDILFWYHQIISTLDTLSRLKGIETYSLRSAGSSQKLWIRFPVWRELKPIASARSMLFLTIAFGYAFPFEGNWGIVISFQLPVIREEGFCKWWSADD